MVIISGSIILGWSRYSYSFHFSRYDMVFGSLGISFRERWDIGSWWITIDFWHRGYKLVITKVEENY